MILSLDVKPALFELKMLSSSSNNESYMAHKNGYICFHFCNINEENETIDTKSKKTFVMTMSSMRDFLDIEAKKYKKKNSSSSSKV